MKKISSIFLIILVDLFSNTSLGWVSYVTSYDFSALNINNKNILIQVYADVHKCGSAAQNEDQLKWFLREIMPLENLRIPTLVLIESKSFYGVDLNKKYDEKELNRILLNAPNLLPEFTTWIAWKLPCALLSLRTYGTHEFEPEYFVEPDACKMLTAKALDPRGALDFQKIKATAINDELLFEINQFGRKYSHVRRIAEITDTLTAHVSAPMTNNKENAVTYLSHALDIKLILAMLDAFWDNNQIEKIVLVLGTAHWKVFDDFVRSFGAKRGHIRHLELPQ